MSLLEQFGRQRDSIKARIRRRSRDRRRRQMKLIPNPLVRLEDRQLLSQTFTVTDPVNDGSTGSLNWAIGQVNADTTDLATSPDIIAFDIPGTGPFTMQAPGYTGVANPVIIDGYTQPGASPNTLAQGDNAVLQIVLDASGYGLLISGGSSTVEGLAINDCNDDIALNGINYTSTGETQSTYGGDTVTGCFLGTDVTGEQVVSTSGGGTGVEIDDISNNTIGGTTPADRNIISNGATGFLTYGVWVTGSSSGDNLIEGNYIGTDATGTQSLGNYQGVSFYSFGAGNTLGGTAQGAGNVISGSYNEGVIISGSSGGGVLVDGNFIGTDASGTTALPNATVDTSDPGSFLGPGVLVGTPGNTIGGTSQGAGNVISGNINDGIDIVDEVSLGAPVQGGQDNLIEGNEIGTNADGTAALPNGHQGIGLSDNAQFNTIGGAQPGAGNVISGNNSTVSGSCGIYLSANGDNLIQGNLIGTNAAGDAAIPNYQGILVQCSGNTIGGTQAGAGNVISGNTWGGVILDDGGNLLQGNLIGTSSSGDSSVPNGFLSYYYVGGIDVFSNSNTIGGTAAGAGNVISGNGSDGVDIVYTSDNLVEGNLIGVGANGTEPLGNGGGGISGFNGASYNTIGGTASGAGNVIANNETRPGVNIGVSDYDDCTGDEILSNSIYNNGMLGINLGFSTSPTQNSPGGNHGGPNDLQNYPVLTAAESFSSYSAILITGTLNSAPLETYTLQFFASTTADPSGFGEGQTLIGTTTVTTDAAGNASFNAVFFGQVVPVGDVVSATATDPYGNTSEFAQDVTAVAGTEPLQAESDTYATDENTTLTVPAPGVQANDISVLGPFTSQLVSTTSDGTLSFNSDGSFTYVPDNGFNGIDSFSYDDSADGTVSNVSTVTIYVGTVTLTVTNTLDDGSTGSLPWALSTANSIPSNLPVDIDFDIPGTGPFVIQPTTPLPAIARPLTIDGYTQPGASPNTNTFGQGDNAVILIDINGSSVSNSDGLDVEAGNSVIEGLAINQFSNDAIHLESAGGDVVEGNFLGTDPTGENSEGNNVGVYIDNVGANTIGGLTPAALNVLSGNNSEGITINGSNATGNLIAGNYIGTDATGTNRLPNGMGLEFQNNSWGNTVGGSVSGAGNLISGNNGDATKIDGGCYNIVIQGNLIGTDAAGTSGLVNYGNGVDINGNNNTIGGTTPGSGNVLSDNSGDGIVLVFSSASDNLMEGNLIGTDITGTQPLGNGNEGIDLFFSASDNTIGGTVAGAGNTIDFNQNQGVAVGSGTGDDCVGDAILSNSIFDNGKIGIDLGSQGVPLLNSPGSPHTGANLLQSFPVLNEAVAFTGLSTVIVGSLNSDPSSTFTLQFFASPTADPSGFGQGQTLIGTTTVTTDSSGNASFEVSFPVAVTAGYAISATATDSSGDTSEFAQDVFAVAAAPPVYAANDSYFANENTTLNVAAPGVQSNDVSADGGSFTSQVVSPPSNGTLTLNSDGSFSYTPNTNFGGVDSFTYEDVENGQDSNVATVTILVNPLTLVVTNTLDDGSPGSLPWAINLANSDPSSDPVTIDFDIPGTGPFVIQPTTPLPAITHSVIINGYSQPGASANTNTFGQGDNAVILIDINGSSVSNSDGLDVEAGNSVIEGLAINQFSNDAIHLESAGGDVVEGNFLGTDPTGENSEGNNVGVYIDNVGANTIGGLTPAALNVLSGNNSEGITINGSNATGNLIAGNYIGTDATGTNRLPNGMGLEFQNNSWGNTVGGSVSGAGNLISGNNGDATKIDGGCYNIVIQGNLIGTDAAGTSGLVNYGNGVDINGNNNTIGGTTPGSGNVLSDNSGDGIVLVFSSASDNLMEGNLIGTDITGTQPLGNGNEGIDLFFSASDNTIGGTVAGAGNTIDFNQNQGVAVGSGTGDDCVGDAILSNSIFDNGKIGIDLGSQGVPLLNSPGSPHTGANLLQSFPVLNEAVAFTGLSTVIVGSLNSDPSSTFTLQFFASPTADPSGFGQGQTLIGTTTVTTDSSGNASFEVSFPVAVTAGYAISATATDSSGDTSEFAQDVFAVAAAPPIAALNDYYNTDINTTLTVAAPGVQANDVAADGGTFTSILLTSPKHGTLTFNSNGSFTYVPKKSFTGTDTFTYEDDQNGQYSNVATVTISVNPKTLVVTNTNSTGAGSLFQALTIADSSNSPGADTIDFDIPGTGPFEISLTQALPAITHPTVIDGYSQPGAHKNSSSVGDDAVIEIQIDGSSLPNGANGLVLSSSDITVEGLSITRFDSAILVQAPGGDLITGNFLGASPSGTGYGWGNQYGILVTGSSTNTIGGSVAGRNIISANSQAGVELENGSTDNLIASNYIGTDITGVNRLNNGDGIALYDSPNTTIGGSTAAAANVISGNGGDGILVSSMDNGPGSTDTLIEGNYIGIDATGSIELGNGNNGVHLVYGAGTTVGGLSTHDRNIISGNQAGVYLENSATGMLIEGNFIGTDPRGDKALGNQYDGVLLSGTLNTVGGTVAGAGNLISGNGRNGISDGSYAGSMGANKIEGNMIGTDSAGTVALANGQNGVDIGTNNDTVGGTVAGARNLISGNAQYGIRLSGGASGNLVEGNDIGTAKNGSSALGNAQDGVHIQDNATANTIGGTVAGAGNVIDFNGGAGVAVTDSAQFNPILTNSIYSNGDLGINLSGNGNENLGPPALSSAVSKSGSTTIAGSLTGFAANTVYLLQFFSNKTADPSGYGEGQTYLSSLNVTTDSSGSASFQVVFNTSVPKGDFVSATATDPSNDTSGFAADVTVTDHAAPAATASAVKATGLSLVAAPSAPSTQDESVLTALAVEQVQAKSELRSAKGLAQKLEVAARVRISLRDIVKQDGRLAAAARHKLSALLAEVAAQVSQAKVRDGGR